VTLNSKLLPSVTLFIGPPASGKDTQAKLLSSKTGALVISTGDLLRDAIWIHRPGFKDVPDKIREGRPVDWKAVFLLMDEEFSKSDLSQGLIITGFPRSLEQAQKFETLLTKHGLRLDKVISLATEESLVRERMRNRVNLSDDVRIDDNEEVLDQRMMEYKISTQPILDYYRPKGLLVEIDNNQSVADVFKEISTKCQK